MQFRDKFSIYINLFLNMLKSASSLANLMGAAPPTDQPPLRLTSANAMFPLLVLFFLSCYC